MKTQTATISLASLAFFCGVACKLLGDGARQMAPAMTISAPALIWSQLLLAAGAIETATAFWILSGERAKTWQLAVVAANLAASILAHELIPTSGEAVVQTVAFAALALLFRRERTAVSARRA